jgi:protein SCO1
MRNRCELAMKRRLMPMLAMLLALANAQAEPKYPSASVYNLEAKLTNQDSAAHGLDVYRGKPVLVTMFYASCPMACPLIIDTLREVERNVPAEARKELRVLMISIDPEKDTPQALHELAQKRRIDSRWTLARTDPATVRKIAALLNIQYRKLPDGNFNHSSIITLLTADGVISTQSAQLGKADPKLVSAIREATGQRVAKQRVAKL